MRRGSSERSLARGARTKPKRAAPEHPNRESADPSYQLLFGSNPLPMFLVDRETLAFLDVNDAALEQYGYTGEEFLAMTAEDIRPPEDVPRLRDAVASLQPGLNHRGVWKHRTKDGQLIDVEVTVHTLEWRDRPALLASLNDVTKRLRSEVALREGQQRLQALFDHALDAMLLANGEGHYVDANPAACALTGYTREELLTRSILDVTPVADRKLGALLWCTLLIVGTQEGEFTTTRKDGARRIVEYRAVANVAPGLHLAILHDITERKLSEEALRKAREELEGKVEQQLARRNLYGLTFRELTVLHLVAAGKADKEVAHELGISCQTVHKHVGNILHKLHAASRTEASVRALREGLLE